MGKAGRLACIFIPMGLSIASLVCLIFVFLGQREAKNDTTNQYYFFRADASNFTSDPDLDLIEGSSLDDRFLNAITSLSANGSLSDFYQIGLWDYCSGKKTDNNFDVTYCSEPEANYFFNITEVWGLSGSADDILPSALKKGLNAYEKAAHWMFIAYSLAIGVTALEIFVGFFAIFSRWGSCVTTIISSASTLFTVLAAITSTALSATVVGALNTTLKPYGIHSSLGTKMLIVVWLAVAFSLGAGLFWTFSTCCCSGKSGAKRDGGIRKQGTIVEHMPYTHARKHQYKSLGGNSDPYAAGGMGGGVPMDNMAQAGHKSAAYEPYRAV